MRSFPGLGGFVIALGWGTGAAGAQWNAVETQELAQGAEASTYGTAIAISGTTALVTSPGENLTRVYEIDPVTGVWTEGAGIPQAGIAAAVSGDTAVLGAGEGFLDGMATNPGRAWVFDRGLAGWTLVATLEDPDPWPGFWGEGSFGSAVAISGDTIVVGARYNDAAYVFERDLGGSNAWGYAAKLSHGDQEILFGASVDLAGDMALVGATHEQGIGAVFVFERQGANGPWIQTAKLLGSDPDDWFGCSVSLSGTTALVGAGADVPVNSPPGAAYVFERTGSAWQEVAKLSASSTGPGEAFGEEVSLDADTAVVHDPTGLAVCVFKRNHGGVDAWGQIAALPAARSAGVAVAGGQVAVLDELPGVSIPAVRGLAFDPAAGRLHGSILGSDQLVSIDPSSGFTTVIGATGFPDIEGLAFDPASGVLYGADDVGDRLVRIDPHTGAGMAIGPFGFAAVRGLEFDAATNSLFGTDTGVDQLLRIDASTGDATVIGSLGIFNGVQGLAMDPGTNTLYGINSGGSQLVAIDPETGTGTAIGPGGVAGGLVGIEGLAMDPDSGKLLGVDGAERLIEIDPRSGLGTVQQTLWTDLIWVSVNAVSHASETYCTAGTSASGCAALIAASGEPSASAPSGFVVSASGVEGGKDGLFFFGSHGVQAASWGNGTSYQCVVPPVKRTGLLAGVGTNGACDGSFARDLNAFWCPGCPVPQANPGAGAMIQAQLWYRDPASTSNQPTSLSDAVESYVTP